MIKLSVVIITYNEEKNIRRCLESVSEIADEIIVLDSFSSDKTKDICNEFNVKFTQHRFDGHIQQKNRAISLSSYDYILSLDADEALSDELKKSIIEVKNNWQYDGYEFNRLTNYCGNWIRHCGWYPDRKLRLIKKSHGTWGGINPHDKLILKENSTKSIIRGNLLHYSFYSINQHIDQINKFSQIAATANFKQGKRTNLLQIVIAPLWKFFHSYLIKAGFLDGYSGFLVCSISSFAKFLKYSKLLTMLKQNHE